MRDDVERPGLGVALVGCPECDLCFGHRGAHAWRCVHEDYYGRCVGKAEGRSGLCRKHKEGL